MDVQVREFCIDDDTIYVEFSYDEEFSIWIGDYPYFDEEPRVTPNGRLWRNVTNTDCLYADPQFQDCGTCPYLKKQDPHDLIGVCFNDALVTILNNLPKEEEI